ncbi:MAG: hypothetical protein MI810_02500 [Flavobacteriales bacterium]|nr:hypothetical protein [Flavobacteriales bacterium]
MIQDLIIDSLNGFSFRYLPFFLFQLCCAALFAHIFQIFFNKKLKRSALAYSALNALFVAFLVVIAKISLPIAVIAAAVILLWLKGKNEDKITLSGQIIVLGIGLGCGTGSIVQTFIGLILILLVALFTPLNEE